MTAEELQRTLKKPKAVQQRPRGLAGGNVTEGNVDSGATSHFIPVEVARQVLKDRTEVTGEEVETAGEEAGLQIRLKGALQALARTETGHYKETNMSMRGVEGLRQAVFSVPAPVRDGCVVHLAPEIEGGSYLKFPDATERFPIESEAGRHFRLALRVKADEKLAVREKQVINYFTLCKFGHIGQRIIDETKRAILSAQSWGPVRRYLSEETWIQSTDPGH